MNFANSSFWLISKIKKLGKRQTKISFNKGKLTIQIMRICQTLHKLQLNLKPQLCPIFNFFVMKK